MSDKSRRKKVKESKFEPCPFCGGTDVVMKHSGRWGYFVACNCTAVGPGRNTFSDALDAWNTRLRPRRERLFR